MPNHSDIIATRIVAMRDEAAQLRARADRLDQDADRLASGGTAAADTDFAMYTDAGNLVVAVEVEKLIANATGKEHAVQLLHELEAPVRQAGHREIIDTAVQESIVAHLIDRGVFADWDDFNAVALSV